MNWKVWSSRLGVTLLALGIALGCDKCPGGVGMQVGGDTPYERCLAAAPAASGTSRIGGLTVRARGRDLTIEGLPRALIIAAFSGPGFGPAPGPALIAAVAAAKPDLALMLGDLGDSAATARATAIALAKLPAPTLFVAGGRDTRARIAEAWAATGTGRERIIDVTGVRSVRVGADTLVPIAGAADGRYASDPKACGYGLDDLKRVASDIGAEGEGRRWLVAWQAPATNGWKGVARDDRGVELGSPVLAELARRIGANGGIFAWPHEQLLRPLHGDPANSVNPGAAVEDLRIVVPRLTGAALERGDGSRVLPGFALLRLDPHGLALLEARASP